MDDVAALLGHVALRDRAAFARLYGLTSAKLFAIAFRILRDRGDADEALQEIYIKVWRRAERYQPEQGSPMTWLAAIARNHAIDLIRARKPEASSIEEAFDLASESTGPEEDAINSSEGKRFDRCMQTLESD